MSDIDAFLKAPAEPNDIDSFLGTKAPPKRTALGTIGDIGVSALKGAIAVPEAAVGIADIATGGRVGKALENEGGSIGFRPKEANAALDELYSPAQQAANKEVADAKGFFPTAGAMLQNPSTIGQAVVQSLPAMGAGGLVGRGVMSAAPGVGRILGIGAGEGVVGAGLQAESTRQQTADGLLTPKQSLLAAGSGAVNAAITAGSGRVANRLGIGDIDQMILTGQMGGAAAKKGMIRRAGEGALTEGVLEEAPQSASEQALQNIALDRPVGEGVGSATAQGMLTGGLTGAAVGPFVSEPQQQAKPAPQPKPGAPLKDASPPEAGFTTTPGDAIRAAAPEVIGPLTGGVAAMAESQAKAVDAAIPTGDAQELTGQAALKARRESDLAQFAADNQGAATLGSGTLDAGLDARELSLEEAAALVAPQDTKAQPIPTGTATELPLETVEPTAAPDPQREPRTPKPQSTRGMTDADVVQAYVEQRRTEGTLAGRRFAGDFDAGRINPEDVMALVRGRKEPTPDERLAAAAEQAPKPRTDGLLDAEGKAIEPTKEQPNADQPGTRNSPIVVAGASNRRAPTADAGRSPVGPLPTSTGGIQPATGKPVAGSADSGPDRVGAKPDGALSPLQQRQAKNAPAPSAPNERDAFEHAGLKVYPGRVRVGDKIEDRWAVQLPENKANGKVLGDTLHTTREEAMKAAEREVARFEREQRNRAEQDAADATRRAEEDARKASNAGKSLVERRAEAILDHETSENGERMTRRQWVDRKVSEGLAPRITQEDRIKPLTRSQFNRATGEEQRAHERKIKAGGKKDVYWIGDYEVTKTEHDYAQKRQTQDAPINPPQTPPREAPTQRAGAAEAAAPAAVPGAADTAGQDAGLTVTPEIRAKWPGLKGESDEHIAATEAWDKAQNRVRAAYGYRSTVEADIQDAYVEEVGQPWIAKNRTAYVRELTRRLNAEADRVQALENTPGTLESKRADRKAAKERESSQAAVDKATADDIAFNLARVRELQRQGRLTQADAERLLELARGSKDSFDAAMRLEDFVSDKEVAPSQAMPVGRADTPANDAAPAPTTIRERREKKAAPAPEQAPAPEPERNEKLVALRKQLSVLKSIRKCLG